MSNENEAQNSERYTSSVHGSKVTRFETMSAPAEKPVTGPEDEQAPVRIGGPHRGRVVNGEYQDISAGHATSGRDAMPEGANVLDYGTDANGMPVSRADINGETLIPVGGDRVPFKVLEAAGFVRRGANGPELVPADQPNTKQEEAPAVEGDAAVIPEVSGQTVAHVAQVMGSGNVVAMALEAARGGEASEQTIGEMASRLNTEPGHVREVVSRITNEFRSAAADAIVREGVPDIAAEGFVQWANSQRESAFSDAVVRLVDTNDLRPLRALAREFVKETGAGLTDADLSGAELGDGVEAFEVEGNLILRIRGYGEMPARVAIRQGVVKISQR